jgi:hypothetical protein
VIQSRRVGGHTAAMSSCRPTHDRRAAGPRVSNIAGTCSTCSPPAGDLFGHLLAHLLSWRNRRPILLAKAMIDHGKMRHAPVAIAVEKSVYLQEQVGAGESASIIAAASLPAFAPCALFFTCLNRHSVAMLRNIC